MMNFLKDWIIQYQNKFSVGGVETTIDRITGTVSQEGDTIMASHLNEIQKNCIYQVNATRVIEGVLEIYDISIDGSDIFDVFDTQFIINFNETNTKLNPVLRFNGNNYYIRALEEFTDIDVQVGSLQKTYIGFLDSANNKLKLFGNEKKLTFDTAADMQSATWLVAGDIIELLGYYEKGDGAGHKRKKNILGSTYEWDILDEEINILYLGAKKNDITFDNATVIQEALNRGNTLIPQGEFTTLKKFNSVNNRQLRGNGYLSMIKPNFSIQEKTLVIENAENFIVSNIFFKGLDLPDTQYVNADLSSFGNLWGIETKGTLKNVELLNLKFEGFNGKACEFKHTASFSKRLLVDNIKIHKCAYGIQFALMCEYNKVTNAEINMCNVAYEDNSGNNNFTSSNLNYNWNGFLMTDSGNGGHSIVQGITCNHNNKFSFKFKNIKYGQVIDGVTAFYGKFVLENCEGVNITNGLFGTNEIYVVGGGSINQFIGCTFDNTTTFVTDDISYPKFVNCNSTGMTLGVGNPFVISPCMNLIIGKAGVAQVIGTGWTNLIWDGTLEGYYFSNNSVSSKARALNASKDCVILKGHNTVQVIISLTLDTLTFTGSNTLELEIFRNYHNADGSILTSYKLQGLKQTYYTANVYEKLDYSFIHSDFSYGSEYGYSYTVKAMSSKGVWVTNASKITIRTA